jgi:hypothetical protein
MPERAVDSTRNPETMTVAERRAEIASILARGLVRAVRNAKSGTSSAVQKVSESGDSVLDLPTDSPLSVAPRLAG